MSRAIFEIRIKVYEKTDLFVLYASNKNQRFLELKRSVAYGTIVLLYSTNRLVK